MEKGLQRDYYCSFGSLEAYTPSCESPSWLFFPLLFLGSGHSCFPFLLPSSPDSVSHFFKVFLPVATEHNPLEKEMAPHSSILAWEIPWIEEPGGLQAMGWQRVAHNSVTKQQQHPKSRILLLLCSHSFSPTSLVILCSPVLLILASYGGLLELHHLRLHTRSIES